MAEARFLMRLRQLWDSGQATIGGWCRIGSSFSAEVMGRAGYDWVCVDTQHGLAGHETMVSMLQALDLGGAPTFVRVAWNQPDLIMRALDAGADGIVVPMVNTPNDAEQAVRACRYAPAGFRSWGPARSSMGEPGYSPSSANAAVVCMVMIETLVAIENIDSILAVDGVDGVYVGPSDLAVSCDLPPNTDSFAGPLGDRIRAVLASSERHGKVAGIHCPNVETARIWRDAGFRMLTVANDATLLAAGADKVVREFRRQ